MLKDILSKVKSEDAGIVEDGISADVTGYMDSGSYIFNAMLSGSIYKGFPANKITVLSGESATGKTMFALNIVSQFMKDNPEGVCLYFDSEEAVTKQMIVSRGCDPKRIAVLGVATVEQFRTQAIKVLESHAELKPSERKPMMIVLDSLGMLSTSKEMNDTGEGKETRDMTRAQVIKATFRVLTLRLSKAGVPLIVTNHVYAKIGSMYPENEQAGGSGSKYAASCTVVLSKRKDKEGTEVVGNIIHCKLYKGRLTKENKMVDVRLSYETGLDRYYGLVPLAEKYGIFKKVSTRFEMPDGTKAFQSQIESNPEKYFTQDIMQKLDQAAAAEFLYGSDKKLTGGLKPVASTESDETDDVGESPEQEA